MEDGADQGSRNDLVGGGLRRSRIVAEDEHEEIGSMSCCKARRGVCAAKSRHSGKSVELIANQYSYFPINDSTYSNNSL